MSEAAMRRMVEDVRADWLHLWQQRLEDHDGGGATLNQSNGRMATRRGGREQANFLYGTWELLQDRKLFQAYAAEELMNACVELGFEHHNKDEFYNVYVDTGYEPQPFVPAPGGTPTGELVLRALKREWETKNLTDQQIRKRREVERERRQRF